MPIQPLGYCFFDVLVVVAVVASLSLSLYSNEGDGVRNTETLTNATRECKNKTGQHPG